MAIFVRVAIAKQHSVYPIYGQAAVEWMQGRPIYEQNNHTPNGFVYSPPVAAFFVPFALLPITAGEAVWRLLGILFCFAGLQRWLNTVGHRFLQREWRPVFYGVLLPLFLGNLNNGQANIPMLGLLVWAMAAVEMEEWWVAALCIGLATYLKVYPLVFGLLLAAVHPRKFAWRLLAMLAGLGLLSLVLQHPGYVIGQYKLWIATRLSEDRHQFDVEAQPHDLYMLLNFTHCRLSEGVYKVVKVLAGGAVAALCVRARLRKWPEDALLNSLLGMGCAWVLLCGPATESSTYVLLAPSVLLELMHCFFQRVAAWRRVWMALAFVLLLGSFTIKSLTPWRDPNWGCLQPASALVFFVYLVICSWVKEEKSQTRRKERPRGEGGNR